MRKEGLHYGYQRMENVFLLLQNNPLNNISPQDFAKKSSQKIVPIYDYKSAPIKTAEKSRTLKGAASQFYIFPRKIN